jgi:hypothetical protein
MHPSVSDLDLAAAPPSLIAAAPQAPIPQRGVRPDVRGDTQSPIEGESVGRRRVRGQIIAGSNVQTESSRSLRDHRRPLSDRRLDVTATLGIGLEVLITVSTCTPARCAISSWTGTGPLHCGSFWSSSAESAPAVPAGPDATRCEPTSPASRAPPGSTPLAARLQPRHHRLAYDGRKRKKPATTRTHQERRKFAATR